jgi:O-antigen biosynthesis protein WbqP
MDSYRKPPVSALKRCFDLVIAVLMLPIALPVILVCILAVRATSSGPGIFCQTRVGAGERPFTCYKLRTMYADTLNAPSHETSASSVTPTGRWLRRLKIDELPQLWNVVRGDMSFVGPRPCLPSQKDLILARRSRGLYTILPGITGVSQVAGIDMSDAERLAAFDATYLKDMSLWTDLKLMAATALGFGRGDRVR